MDVWSTCMARRVVPSVSASPYGMFGREVLRWGPYTPSRTGTAAGAAGAIAGAVTARRGDLRSYAGVQVSQSSGGLYVKGFSKRKKLHEFSGSPSVPNGVLGNCRVWEAFCESGVRGGAR